MSYDVSMRLNLEYKDRDARRAEQDLKDIQRAAKRLNSAGTGNLEADLRKISNNARDVASALDVPQEKIKELNGLRTDRLEKELDQVKTAAGDLGGRLDTTTEKFKDLNKLKTDRAETELDDLKEAATTLANKLRAPIEEFRELNLLKTDKAEKELEALGKRAEALEDKLDRLRKRHGTGTGSGVGGAPGQKLTGPRTNLLHSGQGRFGEALYDRLPIGAAVPLSSGGAVAAGAGAGAVVIGGANAYKSFASADRRMTYLGMSAGASEAETEAATKRVRQLAYDLSIPVEQAVSGLEDIIASGVESLEAGLEMLPATLKASIGTGTPASLMATALKSSLDKMNLSADQLPAASDSIITGGRLGKFEVEDMARYLPNLLPVASEQLKYQGVEGLKKVVADLQVVRENSGTSQEAITRVMDFYLKIFQSATQENFKKAGFDLEGTVNGAIENGQDPVTAAIQLTQKAVKKKPGILPKLFTDKESYMAAQAFLANPDGRQSYIDGMEGAAGTTEQSHKRVTQDAQASIDRLSTATSNAAFGIGKLLDKLGLSTLLNSVGGATQQITEEGVSAFPNAMRRTYDRYWTKPASAFVQNLFGGGETKASPFPQSDAATDPVADLEAYLKSRTQPSPEFPGNTLPNVPRAKPGWLPGKQSSLIPDIGDAAGHLQSAGSEAGAKFAAALEAETKRLGSVADNLESRFSFTATPTISPQFSAGSAPPSPAATRSSTGGTGSVVHQTFNGTSDPQRTARYATREQNRAIRRSRNRALHDLGSFA